MIVESIVVGVVVITALGLRFANHESMVRKKCFEERRRILERDRKEWMNSSDRSGRVGDYAIQKNGEDR